MKNVFLFLICLVSAWCFALQAEVFTQQARELWVGHAHPETFFHLKDVLYGALEDNDQEEASTNVPTYLQFSDGSLWRVADIDVEKLKRWESSDLLVVSSSDLFVVSSRPAHWHASKFHYRILNLRINQEIEASFKRLGEKSARAMQRFVGFTEPTTIQLSNGTYWKVPRDSSVDKSASRVKDNWKAGDFIIIALSPYSATRKSGNTLLNLTRQDKSRAVWQRTLKRA